MVTPELVTYIRDNLAKFSDEQLMAQVTAQGWTQADADEAMFLAYLTPSVATLPKPPVPKGLLTGLSVSATSVIGLIGFMGLTYYQDRQMWSPPVDASKPVVTPNTIIPTENPLFSIAPATAAPNSSSTVAPTATPVHNSTPQPTQIPTPKPTPTPEGTSTPTPSPSVSPSPTPTTTPTPSPSTTPIPSPTLSSTPAISPTPQQTFL